MKLSFAGITKGMSSVKVLESLVAQNIKLGAIHAFTYAHAQPLQNRITFSESENVIFSKALRIREKTLLPFWEALMLSCSGEPGDFRRLLRLATFHQQQKSNIIRIERDDVLKGKLDDLIQSLTQGQHLSFSSEIFVTKSERYHLPLLDFHCPESVENDRLVADVCLEIFQTPVLVLSSGASYHAIGTELVDDAGFRAYLIRSLFFAPIVDTRYVAHQMLEGSCALRLSSSIDKPNLPKFKFLAHDSGNSMALEMNK